MTDPLRFIVLQPGARLHYAVPALLARAGMLERLYTDIHAPATPALSWLGRIPPAFLPRALARLVGRRLPPELAGKVSAVPMAVLRESLLPGRQRLEPAAHSLLRTRILEDGFRGGNAFYTLSNLDLELVRRARARGMFVVHEQICNPHIGRVVQEERARFPGLEAPSAEDVEEGIRRDEEQWRLANLVLTPSQYVRSDVLAHGIAPERVAEVPYGIPSCWLESTPTRIPGRILFVGKVALLKGVHYLAEASRILRGRGVPHEVRVIGAHDPNVVKHPAFQGLTYAGSVPRSLVQREFSAADIFAFPSLSEGFALVHLEALASGVPVVTTPNAGSVVRDGVEGYLVPVRDARTLADRLEVLLRDGALRERMSVEARARAAGYVWERYEERLVQALRHGAALPHADQPAGWVRPSSLA